MWVIEPQRNLKLEITLTAIMTFRREL